MAEIAWTSEPPPAAKSTTLSLRRCGPKPTFGIATLDKPLGVWTHFFKGRTRPHITQGPCEACTEGHTARWKGYLTLFTPATGDHWIQEFTLNAWEGLESGIRAHGTLLGHQIGFARTKPSPNAPLRAEVYAPVCDLRLLPATPDLKSLLCRIWSIDPITLDQVQRPDGTIDRLTLTPKLRKAPAGGNHD